MYTNFDGILNKRLELLTRIQDEKPDIVGITKISPNKLTCRPKKRSADKFDSFDPSYCQFLIKL